MRILSLVALLALLAGPALATPEAGSGPEHATLRVLVWNVLRGGNRVTGGPEKALKVIRDADPDLVLLQESYDIEDDRPTLGRWLAGELSEAEPWSAHQHESPHLCVLTRLEIDTEFFHHPWHGVGARLTDDAGRSLVAYTIWLDYRSYITWDLRDDPGISDADLLKAESERSGRLPQAEALLEHLRDRGHLASDVPVLVGGDFNTPSHLDWTADTARVYKRRRDLPLPVSGAFADAGFTDAFRAVHPNPVQRPGITWSPMHRTSGDKAQGFERIDRLYVRNPGADGARALRAVRATVLPEVWEDESVPAEARVFPSDHGAVLIDLVWE
jgi:endonuclease/exonuclease/phosphatase family metal-dependent hydrolase